LSEHLAEELADCLYNFRRVDGGTPTVSYQRRRRRREMFSARWRRQGMDL